ncbi:MAG: 30S ribosomal protein S4 [Anaerolineae bacterium]|nr:MAG: 30S ribosomal protein S4 [Anaerolineae bacterium]
MHDRTRRRRRQSDYGQQLCEKQKVKRMYGMRERQFRRLYKMAQRAREETGAALLKLLERRLDNVIYRLGFARTRPQARQFVNHGHVLVDERRVDIPSYLVKPGQVVALREVVRKIRTFVICSDTRPRYLAG